MLSCTFAPPFKFHTISKRQFLSASQVFSTALDLQAKPSLKLRTPISDPYYVITVKRCHGYHIDLKFRFIRFRCVPPQPLPTGLPPAPRPPGTVSSSPRAPQTPHCLPRRSPGAESVPGRGRRRRRRRRGISDGEEQSVYLRGRGGGGGGGGGAPPHHSVGIISLSRRDAWPNTQWICPEG